MRLARRLAAVSAVAASLSAQSGLTVEWQLPAGGIAVGDPFVVEVRCALPARPRPPLVEQTALWPLSLTLLETRREGDGAVARVVERYRARAFAAGRLEFPELVVRAATAAGEVRAAGTPPPLAVRSILPEPPGSFEWPGDVLEPRAGQRGLWVLAAVLAALAASAWRWRRTRRAAPVVVDTVGPRLQALAALPAPGDDPAAIAAFYGALAALVRDHAAQRWGLDPTARTSEELVALAPAGREALARCLAACDLVKFAARRPGAEDHAAARAAAGRFVRAVASAEVA